jgi:hypothetical protein
MVVGTMTMDKSTGGTALLDRTGYLEEEMSVPG